MISQQDVRHIAKLARLSLDEAEVDTYTNQLWRILGFFDELAALDTQDVPMTAHPLPVANAFREDVVVASLGSEVVLSEAPVREGPYFRVPKILDN